jgi:rod shape-determining protein MreC
MALADIRQRPGVLLAIAVILHVALISAQVSTRTGVPLIEVVTFGAFAEVQRLTMSLVGGVRGFWSGYIALQQVQSENLTLRRENDTLQVRLQEQRALAERAQSLRRLLELRERAGLETMAAEIIAANASTEFRTVTIDRGSQDGVVADQAVIAPGGVVGRIILPSPRAARVQLLIDRNAAAGALIERSRVQGVAVGRGDGELRLDYVPVTADVRLGDLIVTSGIDGIYPKGFVMGTVETVERGAGTYHVIRVRPAVDFTRLEEVLIVLTPPPAHEEGAGSRVP